LMPGPGATDETRERLQLMVEAWENRENK
jgi:hypothetical protein